MKLMIVDDEALIREYIACTIAACKVRCEIVSSVSNAADALRLMEDEWIDVVFADITMPKMNGLELLEQISKKWPQTQVVMLTCHDDFSFVRTAMQNNAADYVLKDELSTESMECLLKKLEEKKRQAVEETRCEIDFSHYIRGIMANNAIDRIDPDELNVYLGGAALRNYAILMFVYHKNILDWLAEHQMAWIKQNWMVPYEERMVLVVVEIVPQLSEHDSFQLLTTLRNGMLTLPMCQLGISRIYHEASLFKQAIWEARMDMNRSFYAGGYITGGDVLQDEEPLKKIFILRNNAVSALTKGNYTEYRGQLKQLFVFAKQQSVDVDRLKRMMRFIAETAFGHMLLSDANMFRGISEAIHITQLEKIMCNLTDYVQRPLYSEGIAAAVRYLDEHFREDLTLQQLSDGACLNYEYFSRRFKKEVGMNYSEYLLQRRLEEGMHLLSTTDALVGDIAAEVGLSNGSYFSSAFKKTYGLSPNEFRKKQ